MLRSLWHEESDIDTRLLCFALLSCAQQFVLALQLSLSLLLSPLATSSLSTLHATGTGLFEYVRNITLLRLIQRIATLGQNAII